MQGGGYCEAVDTEAKRRQQATGTIDNSSLLLFFSSLSIASTKKVVLGLTGIFFFACARPLLQ